LKNCCEEPHPPIPPLMNQAVPPLKNWNDCKDRPISTCTRTQLRMHRAENILGPIGDSIIIIDSGSLGQLVQLVDTIAFIHPACTFFHSTVISLIHFLKNAGTSMNWKQVHHTIRIAYTILQTTYLDFYQLPAATSCITKGIAKSLWRISMGIESGHPLYHAKNERLEVLNQGNIVFHGRFFG
jgi:hypothetical protein